MLRFRSADSRGHAQHGWLDSHHSFSFASYYDPAYMGYSVLRVINEDKIAPGTGFGMHAHQDMEIITYVLAGALRHTDSMGNSAILQAGDVQHMTAGTGIRHSEMNASAQTMAHFLQIWVQPDQAGLAPAYADRTLTLADKHNRWATVAAPARQHAAALFHIPQDLWLYATHLHADHALPLRVKPGRCGYLHVAFGEVALAGHLLRAGDALMLDAALETQVQAAQDSELLWFDLPVLP